MKKGVVMNIPRRFVESEWGGTETVIKETSKQLQKIGFRPEIVTTKALSDQSEEIIDNVPVKRFRYSYTRWGLSQQNKRLLDMRGGNMYSLGLLLYLLFARDIQVIHLHTLGRLGNLGRLVAKIRRIPYIVSIHGGLLDLPKKQVQDLVAPTKSSFNWGKVVDWLYPSTGLMRDASAIVCVGEAEREKVKACYPDKNVVHLPNGVDLSYVRSGCGDRFFGQAARQGVHWRKSDKIILCVSSFYEQKNQLSLLKAFHQARSTQPNIRLLLVGVVYDQDYYESLIEYVNRHHLGNDVWIRTDVKYGEASLTDCYKAADVFVLPSLYETFGIVVLEAWAAGIAVICGDAGGLKSLVTHEKDAYVAEVGSAQSLQDGIIKLVEDRDYKRGLEQNATKTVTQYSWQSIAERLATLYESV